MSSQHASGSRPTCFACQLRERNEWCVLSEHEVALLSRCQTSRTYRPGEAIYMMGDACRGVYCIAAGTIGVRKLDAAGNSVLLHLAYPGDTLGYRAFLANEEHRTSAEALGSSTVCLIERPALTRLLAMNPALGLQFLRRATDDLHRAEEKILQTTTLSNRTRLIHLLLVLLERHGQVRADGERSMKLPLSRGDMASIIGTRHETVSRIVARLEAEGIAHFSGRKVHVPQIEALIDELVPPPAN